MQPPEQRRAGYTAGVRGEQKPARCRHGLCPVCVQVPWCESWSLFTMCINETRLWPCFCVSKAFFMVCCDINQFQHRSAPNKSYGGARQPKQSFLNYSSGRRDAIDSWNLIICLSVSPYIHVSRVVKRSERSTARNMVALTAALIRIGIGLKLSWRVVYG